MNKITLPKTDHTNGELSKLVVAAMAENDAKSAEHPSDPDLFVLTLRANDKYLAKLQKYAVKEEKNEATKEDAALAKDDG